MCWLPAACAGCGRQALCPGHGGSLTLPSCARPPARAHPRVQVSSDETERLIKMEEVLHGRVIGQEEAVTAISRAIRRARVGLKNPNRPIASFIFSGERQEWRE